MNAFTGIATAKLENALKLIDAYLDRIENDPDWAGGGGSPLESLYERHDDLVRELKLRAEAGDDK